MRGSFTSDFLSEGSSRPNYGTLASTLAPERVKRLALGHTRCGNHTLSLQWRSHTHCACSASMSSLIHHVQQKSAASLLPSGCPGIGCLRLSHRLGASQVSTFTRHTPSSEVHLLPKCHHKIELLNIHHHQLHRSRSSRAHRC